MALFADVIQPPRLVSGIELLSILLCLRILFQALYNRYLHPYRHVPGPFWASITSLWYFRSVRYGLGDNTQYPIHRKYGSVVRVTPNMVSIADPAAIETIYGPKKVFQKSEFYDGFNPKISPRRDGFSDRDEKQHAIRRRITAPLYTQKQILSHEADFDRVIALFCKQMTHFAETGEVFDMSIWLRKYTFDIIGELFYGLEGGFGMIRDNVDYKRWCHLLEVMPAPVSALTYVPKGLRNLYFMSQMLFKPSRDGIRGFFTVIDQAHAATKERLDQMKDPKWSTKNDNLALMMNMAEEKGEASGWGLIDVTNELWATIWEGSDTTAIALISVFYHLHKHPDTLRKLLEEIDTATLDGTLTWPVRFMEANKLPYLHAVVQESMRIHSSLGTGLPRIVPEGGAEICGKRYAGGCEVIMSAMAVHFDKNIFGEDCDQFVPERWLRDGEKKATEMERNMLQFGFGPRMCAGKHVTNTEMYKLLPTILRQFRFELMNEEWTVFRGWFQHAKNVNVKVFKRQANDSEAIKA